MPDLIPGLGFLAQIAVVLLAFSFMVFVHELGHFLAARLVGVRVERFFIGFDIFGMSVSKKIGNTVYGIGALPLGGYVALAGQNDDPRKEVITGAADELRSRPLWAQGLVFVSGVLMNFFFGFVLLVWAYMHGIPFVPNLVGEVLPDQPAAVHGLRQGDRILGVNGRLTPDFEGVHGAIAETPVDREMILRVERPVAGRDPEVFDLRILGVASGGRGNLNTIGVLPPESRVVAGVAAPYVDERTAALFSVGDEIVAIGDEPIGPDGGAVLRARLLRWPSTSVELTVRRAATGAEEKVEAPLRTFGQLDLGFRVGGILHEVSADSAAEAAGLKAGDVIVAIQLAGDERPRLFKNIDGLREAITASALRPLDVTYRRSGDEHTIRLHPRLLPGSMLHSGESNTLLGVVGVQASLADIDAGRAGRAKGPSADAGGSEADDAPLPDVVTGLGAAPGGPWGYVVENVIENGPAAGLLAAGDVIVAVAGRPLGSTSLREVVEEESIVPMTVFVRRPGAGDPASGTESSAVLDPEKDASLLRLQARVRLDPRTRRPLIGITFAGEAIIGVERGSAAARYLQGELNPVGARLEGLAISQDLRTVSVRMRYPETVGGAPSAAPQSCVVVLPLPEEIRRDPLGHGLERGLYLEFSPSRQMDRLAFGDALVAAGGKWVDIATMVFRHLKKLVSTQIPVSAMGGPLKLFEVIKIADDRGFGYLLYIVALISINLGICNILPFPVLDGGHVCFLIYEGVTGRKPNEKVRETLQWIGLLLLLTLMLTVTGYDLFDFFRSS